jgi:hypothetical protein
MGIGLVGPESDVWETVRRTSGMVLVLMPWQSTFLYARGNIFRQFPFIVFDAMGSCCGFVLVIKGGEVRFYFDLFEKACQSCPSLRFK